jgi:1-acyl-sn-glycerol-3-phosphate acyltransferase
MLLARSLLFYFGLSLTTLIFVPLSILIYPLAFPLRFKIVSQWSVINLHWLKLCCNLDHKIEGLENIPDTEAAIIMCKHQSAWETLALQVIFPPQIWVLKRELLWIPIYGWGLAAMEPIAIDRSSTTRALRKIVGQGCERLAQGLWVVIFPEGTRTKAGTRQKYQPGGGMLASKSEYPVIPVAHNSGYFWPRNSIRKFPGTITMVIGPAITSAGKSAKEITQESEEWIESTVQGLPGSGIHIDQ